MSGLRSAARFLVLSIRSGCSACTVHLHISAWKSSESTRTHARPCGMMSIAFLNRLHSGRLVVCALDSATQRRIKTMMKLLTHSKLLSNHFSYRTSQRLELIASACLAVCKRGRHQPVTTRLGRDFPRSRTRHDPWRSGSHLGAKGLVVVELDGTNLRHMV